MKDKKVQVTEGFLCTAMLLARDVKLAIEKPEEHTINIDMYLQLASSIISEVDTILEARERRKAFTDYKTAAKNTADRERLRLEYMDMVGIHKNFRSATEKAP